MKLLGEALIAVMVILAAAEAMQLIWWLSVQFHEPLDKVFIAASCICYTVLRVALLMNEE